MFLNLVSIETHLSVARMEGHYSRPNVISFSGVISACEKGHHWSQVRSVKVNVEICETVQQTNLESLLHVVAGNMRMLFCFFLPGPSIFLKG